MGVSSTDYAESLFWRSRLKLSSLKSLKFLYGISLVLALDKTSDNPVKTVSVLKKLFGLFVKIWSMQLGLFGFL